MTVTLDAQRTGLLANRPAWQRKIGAHYYATDTHQLFEYGSGGWVEVNPVSFDKIIFKAGEFAADTGATFGLTNHYPTWTFADAATQGIAAAMTFPPGWANFHIGFTWINPNAGSGNVRWNVQMWNFAIGADLVTEAPAVDLLTTQTAAAQNVVNAGFLAQNQPVNPAFFGSEFGLRVARIGADGADTLVGAVAVGIVTMNRVDL